MYVEIPRAPYALHSRARRINEEDEDERELPVAPYDEDDVYDDDYDDKDDDDGKDDDYEPQGTSTESVVERHGWVAFQTDEESDEETQVEAALSPRSASSPRQQRGRGRPRKEEAKGKARAAAEEPPAKRQRTARSQSARRSAPLPAPVPAAAPALTFVNVAGTTPVGSAKKQQQGGFYKFRVSLDAPARAAPPSTPVPVPARPPSSPAMMGGGPPSPGVPVYESVDRMYDDLAVMVARWRAARAEFRFKAAWVLWVAGEVLDEPFVRGAAQDVVDTVGMPFRCVS